MKRGFLNEVILSAALLCVVGVLTAWMFLRADTMTQKARDLDLAVLAAQEAVETIKAGGSCPKMVRVSDTLWLEAGWEMRDGLRYLTVQVERTAPYLLDTGGTMVFSMETAVTP